MGIFPVSVSLPYLKSNFWEKSQHPTNLVKPAKSWQSPVKFLFRICLRNKMSVNRGSVIGSGRPTDCMCLTVPPTSRTELIVVCNLKPDFSFINSAIWTREKFVVCFTAQDECLLKCTPYRENPSSIDTCSQHKWKKVDWTNYVIIPKTNVSDFRFSRENLDHSVPMLRLYFPPSKQKNICWGNPYTC